jgi:hypothetical protein
LVSSIRSIGGLVDEPVHVLATRQVADDRTAAELLRQRLQHFGSAAGEDQLGAVWCERSGDGLADASGGSGYQHLSLEESHGAAV